MSVEASPSILNRASVIIHAEVPETRPSLSPQHSANVASKVAHIAMIAIATIGSAVAIGFYAFPLLPGICGYTLMGVSLSLACGGFVAVGLGCLFKMRNISDEEKGLYWKIFSTVIVIGVFSGALSGAVYGFSQYLEQTRIQALIDHTMTVLQTH